MRRRSLFRREGCEATPTAPSRARVGFSTWLIVNREVEGEGLIMLSEKIKNDLFYVCSLVEYVERKTNNKRVEKSCRDVKI